MKCRLLVILALIVLLTACGGDSDRIAELEQEIADLETVATTADAETTGTASTTTTTRPPTTTTTRPPTTTTTRPPTTTTIPAPQFTRSEENAIRSAESYLDFSAFSRSGLIGQLEYEGFTNAEATYGVDYLDVDWNEQAWKSAESYLDFSAFSRSSLIDQLIYEGFTREQATYGVDQTGL